MLDECIDAFKRLARRAPSLLPARAAYLPPEAGLGRCSAFFSPRAHGERAQRRTCPRPGCSPRRVAFCRRVQGIDASGVFEVVAAVLWIGNVEFTGSAKEPDTNATLKAGEAVVRLRACGACGACGASLSHCPLLALPCAPSVCVVEPQVPSSR